MPKKYVLESPNLSVSDRKIIENEISKLVIVNLIDAEKIKLYSNKDSFPLVIIHVQTKQSEYNSKVSEALFKAINQKLILYYTFSSDSFFTTKRSGVVLTSKSLPMNEWNFKLSGTSMYEVWDNLLIDIFEIKKNQNRTLDESIVLINEVLKMEENVRRLEEKARREIQPRKKRILVEQIKKIELEIKEKIAND